MGEFEIHLKKSKRELFVKVLNRLDFSCVSFSSRATHAVRFQFVRYFLFLFEQELALLSHRSNLNARFILFTIYTS